MTPKLKRISKTLNEKISFTTPKLHKVPLSAVLRDSGRKKHKRLKSSIKNMVKIINCNVDLEKLDKRMSSKSKKKAKQPVKTFA